MASNVLPLKDPKALPTLAELVSRVRQMAQVTENIGLHHPHLRARMAERGVTMRQILETVRKGEGISGPTKDVYGDWRIKLRRLVAGRRVQVVVAVREINFTVVTVI